MSLNNSTINTLSLRAGLSLSCLVGSLLPATANAQDNGVDRLLHRAEVRRRVQAVEPAPDDGFAKAAPIQPATTLIPSDVAHDNAMKNQQGSAKLVTFEPTTTILRGGFVSRKQDSIEIQGEIAPLNLNPATPPTPIASPPTNHHAYRPGSPRWNPNATMQEYVFDGSDRAGRTQVDANFNVYGLDTEDTIGHFDTLDGQRIVTPSNRVAIYAPRFGSVRKIDGLVNAQYNQPTSKVAERQQTVQAVDRSLASTANMNLALQRSKSTGRATAFIDRTRGVTGRSLIHLRGYRNSLNAIQGEKTLELQQLAGAISAQLQKGIQAATSWESDLGLRVVTQGIQPIIVRDLRTAQELDHIESEDGIAILRVLKVADKIAASAGEEVEFTIRFDNISSQKIGNVTLMDNLTRRLEYIDGSSECSLNSEFKSEINDAGSLALRWEITDPVDAGSGGIIRFRCRVR